MFRFEAKRIVPIDFSVRCVFCICKYEFEKKVCSDHYHEWFQEEIGCFSLMHWEVIFHNCSKFSYLLKKIDGKQWWRRGNVGDTRFRQNRFYILL